MEHDKETKTKSSEASPEESAKSLEGGEHSQPSTKRLSGAARRKLKRARMGEGSASRRDHREPHARPQTSRSTPMKRHRSDGSTPKEARRTEKRSKVSTKVSTVKSFRDVVSGFRMAFIHEDPETFLSEEETGGIKSWILSSLDKLQKGEMYPRFADCRHRHGALHITCQDEATRDWLTLLLQQETPWEGAKLRFIDAKNLPKPIRTMVWIPGPQEEPATLLNRIEKQNPEVSTKDWRVVDRKDDDKGQQLIVVMDQTSWDQLGKACNHRPYLNFSQVLFKALAKPKPEEEPVQKGEEGNSNKEPQTSPSTSKN